MDGDCRNDGRGVRGNCCGAGGGVFWPLAAEDGVSGAPPPPRGNGGGVAAVERRAAGDAKEKERAESGDAPTSDGLLLVGTTEREPTDAGMVERYHGLTGLSVGVTENRDEAEPTPAFPTTAAGSNRSDAVRGYAVNEASSSESSKSSEHTAVVAGASSTNGRTPYNTGAAEPNMHATVTFLPFLVYADRGAHARHRERVHTFQRTEKRDGGSMTKARWRRPG